jgi:hypothetical protein
MKPIHMFDQIALNSKAAEKTTTYVQCSMTFFVNRSVYEIAGKNMADPDRPQTTIQYGACALRAG